MPRDSARLPSTLRCAVRSGTSFASRQHNRAPQALGPDPAAPSKALQTPARRPEMRWRPGSLRPHAAPPHEPPRRRPPPQAEVGNAPPFAVDTFDPVTQARRPSESPSGTGCSDPQRVISEAWRGRRRHKLVGGVTRVAVQALCSDPREQCPKLDSDGGARAGLRRTRLNAESARGRRPGR